MNPIKLAVKKFKEARENRRRRNLMLLDLDREDVAFYGKPWTLCLPQANKRKLEYLSDLMYSKDKLLRTQAYIETSDGWFYAGWATQVDVSLGIEDMAVVQFKDVKVLNDGKMIATYFVNEKTLVAVKKQGHNLEAGDKVRLSYSLRLSI